MEPVDTPRVFSNRYELTHMIARGGMAQVYRARDRLLDRPVALKVLFPELSVDRAFVERFRREAQAAANLSHPNIVPVFDWGEDGGTYFIVMEFIDGIPLSGYLRAQGPQAPDRVVDVGTKVAAALAYAHRHGVIHRDVKPGNILLTADGDVKVTDFGIARAVNTEESLTQTGAVMGTATYFSPEQAEGVGVDARSDIYSLGVVLYEMVAGRPPFTGESPVSIASKHVRDQPPDLRDLAPAVPSGLCSVIMKSMSKSPSLRYSTADEMRADLLRFHDGAPVLAPDANATGVHGPVTHATSSTQAVPLAPGSTASHTAFGNGNGEKSSHRMAWILAGLLVILAIIVLLFLKEAGYLGASTVKIPNVVGKSAATAKAILRSDGFALNSTVSLASTSVPKDDVIMQKPGSGSSVKKGSHVTLTVSSGVATKTVSVPNVVSESLTQAEATLQKDTLGFHVETVTSDTPPNTVVSEVPTAGSTVKAGTSVTLSVPKTSNVKVPNVLGLTAAQAGSVLGATGLKVGATTSACTSAYGNGLVSGANPPVGASVTKGTSVGLVVSTGPCTGIVPGVLRSTVTTAKNVLFGAGFTNVTTATTTPTKTAGATCTTAMTGKVVAQTPTPGVRIPTTTRVTITVCKVPKKRTPPTTSTTTTTSTSTTTTTAPGLPTLSG